MVENKIHRGAQLKDIVEQSRLSISLICEMIGKSRPTLYRWFEDSELSENIFKKVQDTILSVDSNSNLLEENRTLWKRIHDLEQENLTLKNELMQIKSG